MVAAVQKWRPYLLGNHFKLRTDHHSLKFLLEQRITTPVQQKWLSKLAGYDFKISYKKGQENTAADALSRKFIPEGIALNAILQGTSTELLKEIKNSWNVDTQLKEIIKKLQDGTHMEKPYTFVNNQLRWKGKLMIGNDNHLRLKLIHMIHAGTAGGHSGFLPTLHRLKSIFYLKGMEKAAKSFIQECDLCQQNKYETTSISGLLQLLPIPDKVWSDVSLDFVEGLPKSNGKTTILVVVDRLSKYAHFIALAHPYTASTVAQAYLDNIYKVHGMPQTLISDRDAIFLSKFWQELLKLLKVESKMSTAYHQQTDGQTEVVNRYLETYLRCMTGERPKEWAKWLSLSEWWYNTNFHSSTKCTPYDVLYDQKPPLHVPYIAGSASIEAVHKTLQDREDFLKQLKHHLHQARNKMKVQADKHHREKELTVGDSVYVKLQPYRQNSLGRRSSHKLSPRYFGPFEVIARIGKVAYKLKLLEYAKIHPIFHISLLKRRVGSRPMAQILPAEITTLGQIRAQPVTILKRRAVLRKRRLIQQGLIQWSQTNTEDASWEDLDLIRQQYPLFHIDP
ncbi:hypothetical protein AXF42_Ash016579 [Apostasia shenzhenica]|uniref:Integrase catalytic domain-containing protein n=1 Tax=Apostasia shenzhenica TaxID=1088818 RepID=A0A2I0A1G6_9ASPA|nr:hypothetical protein AXF42_Ash016579 [Apostasia shenzhenica]